MRNIYVILFSLYWAQGLPVGFMTHALPVILRSQGVSLAHIGGFGLLMLPWSLKVFWAPWVDRLGSVTRGHYRSWIIPTQLLSVAVLVFLSFIPVASLDQPVFLLAFFIALLFMNTTGATQDVATDGLAVSILKADQQHWGNTFQVIGSRLGFIVGGGAVLWALDWLQWQNTFLLLAALVLLNTLPVLLFREPARAVKQQVQKPVFSIAAIRKYLDYFGQTQTLKKWLVVLLTFKIADGLAGPLLKPLMVDLGLSFSDIGLYVTMLGALAALLGAGLAGAVLRFWSRAKCLILFSILKIFSLLAFAWLAYQYETGQHPAHLMIYLINAFEDLTSSMLLVVMLTLIMQYSRKQMAGTDFTFQVALMATVSGGLYMLGGILGDLLGYTVFLGLICLIGCLCLIPVLRWAQYQTRAENCE
jgi:PAT family beta-lactamase induction signal transducer AmpG